MAPRVLVTPRSPANLYYTEVDAMTIAHDAHPSTEVHDDPIEAHYTGLERLHACYEVSST